MPELTTSTRIGFVMSFDGIIRFVKSVRSILVDFIDFRNWFIPYIFSLAIITLPIICLFLQRLFLPVMILLVFKAHKMNYLKAAHLFLGVSMIMFGILKFFDPFKEWYKIQIQSSGLGQLSYGMGIAGEIMVGILFLIVFLWDGSLKEKTNLFLTLLASVTVLGMMTMAIYVHIHPAVPAAVLPLKIKPPVIPVFFMVVALVSLFTVMKQFSLKMP